MADSVPKAILFDLDDTLLDYTGGNEDHWRMACEQHVHLAPGISADDLLGAVDEYRYWYWDDPERHRRGRLRLAQARREIVRGALARLGIDDPSLADAIGDTYTELREQALCLFPDAISTLDRLRDMGFALGLITNGQSVTQRRKIERFDLERHFDHIQVEEEFGIGKPDERAFTHALEQLSLRPHEAWMVGDNLEWDVAAPQRVGISGIWYDRRGRGLPQGTSVRPDRIITTLAGLVQEL